jgi:hypothetical protein
VAPPRHDRPGVFFLGQLQGLVIFTVFRGTDYIVIPAQAGIQRCADNGCFFLVPGMHQSAITKPA